jgi:hypothetical protein
LHELLQAGDTWGETGIGTQLTEYFGKGLSDFEAKDWKANVTG